MLNLLASLRTRIFPPLPPSPQMITNPALQAASPSNTHYLSNLRTSLTALVIVHHVAIPYGGTGAWAMYESPFERHGPFKNVPLVMLNVVDQTFFMGCFFVVSGWFSAVSAAKVKERGRGGEGGGGGGGGGRDGDGDGDGDGRRWKFVKGKWKRLGVPALVYTILGPPVTRGIVCVVKEGTNLIGSGVWRSVWEEGRKTRGVRGAVWYCALLLIFDASYAFWFPRHFKEKAPQPGQFTEQAQHPSSESQQIYKDDPESKHSDSPLPLSSPKQPGTSISSPQAPTRPSAIPTSTVFLALTSSTTASFLLRLAYPSGTRHFTPLNLNPGYLPQYILFYSTGIAAQSHYRVPLHQLISTSTRKLLGLTVLGVNVVGFGCVHLAMRSGGKMGDVLEGSRGGWNRWALMYAVWNESAGILLSSLILPFFASSSTLPFTTRKWKIKGWDLARYSYPAFLVHTPVVVGLQCVADRWDAGGVVKTGVVGVLGIVGSWGVGWVLVRVLEAVGWGGYV